MHHNLTLPFTPPTLDSMAATFGVSERVLRRKLVAEGMSFCALRDRVRRNLSELCLMEGKRSIGEIAVLLGYGEISAFTRAHKNGTACRHARDSNKEQWFA